MMEKITLYLFWTGMLACASLAITIVWNGETAPEFIFRITATCFILGFANFLLWLPMLLYRFLKKA